MSDPIEREPTYGEKAVGLTDMINLHHHLSRIENPSEEIKAAIKKLEDNLVAYTDSIESYTITKA